MYTFCENVLSFQFFTNIFNIFIKFCIFYCKFLWLAWNLQYEGVGYEGAKKALHYLLCQSTKMCSKFSSKTRDEPCKKGTLAHFPTYLSNYLCNAPYLVLPQGSTKEWWSASYFIRTQLKKRFWPMINASICCDY